MPLSPVPAPATAPATRQRRKETRPQELLDAALALFVEKGFAATRSEEVAARAGVSKGTLYLYYPSKEELFKAVVRHNVSQILVEAAEVFDSYTGSSADLLTMLLTTWWQRVGNTAASGIQKIMMAEAGNFPDIAEFHEREVIHPAQQLLTRALQRGIERGEFRPVPLMETTVALYAPMLFLALHKHSVGACTPMDDIDADRVVAAHLDLVCRGLAAEPAPLASRGNKPTP